MKYYITLITGYRDDQKIDIPMQEAHKAYHLFRNPDQRGVFDSGIAIVGKTIQEIIPNWNKTMGWNPTHIMTADDWNEINGNGVGTKMQDLIEEAKQVSDMIEKNPNLAKMHLGEIKKLPVDSKLLLN